MTPDWIAADWGTSNLRLWAIAADGSVLGMRGAQKEMDTQSPDAFEAALLEVAGDWIDGAAHVVACGMVGSREGWIEAPYQTAPCTISPRAMVTAPTKTDGLVVHVIPGICQTDPADVMRGEETQIAGFLAEQPDWDGVICLPGTHTKWVHISAKEVVSFQTFMTGEIFSLLGGLSVLRHSIAPSGWDDDAFEDALSTILSRPEALAARLFALRADQVVHDTDRTVARARLSGLLVGAELAAAKPYWLGQQIAVIGADAVSLPYIKGLAVQGVTAEYGDAAHLTLAGLKAAHAMLKDT